MPYNLILDLLSMTHRVLSTIFSVTLLSLMSLGIPEATAQSKGEILMTVGGTTIDKEEFLHLITKGKTVDPSAAILTKEEFDEDLKRFKYVKKLMRKYINSDILKHHLILNHLIILFNVFNVSAKSSNSCGKQNIVIIPFICINLLFFRFCRTDELLQMDHFDYKSNHLLYIVHIYQLNFG
mgnify:CR=1 FL=1